MAETKKKVLVVDDDLVLADLLANKLKLSGYEPAIAIDGQKAVEILDKQTFDLILLDLQMPWFDGFHVLEDLKEKKSTTPVIIISNLGGVEDINRAKALGAKDYLVKTSVTPDLVIQEIKKFLK